MAQYVYHVRDEPSYGRNVEIVREPDDALLVCAGCVRSISRAAIVNVCDQEFQAYKKRRQGKDARPTCLCKKACMG